MKITKLGHCCLLIEEKEIRILTDPGNYSTKQNEIKDINVVIITHEHTDHLHVESLKTVIKNNPSARIITNSGVGKILEKENIKYEIVEDKQSITISEILIEGFGDEHAYIYETVTPVQNTGYFINNRLFYPGDAFYNPGKPVDVLALPVVGPWMKISDAIEYAKAIRPKVCFPVHDGMLHSDHRLGPVHRLPKTALESLGIKFVPMLEGSIEEF